MDGEGQRGGNKVVQLYPLEKREAGDWRGRGGYLLHFRHFILCNGRYEIDLQAVCFQNIAIEKASFVSSMRSEIPYESMSYVHMYVLYSYNAATSSTVKGESHMKIID